MLGKQLNRRRVSVALGSLGVATAATVIVPLAMLRAAEDRPGEQAAPQQQKAQEDVSRNPETPPAIAWGEPSNGLRAALVVHRASDKPDGKDDLDLYLAVQNVSQHHLEMNLPPNAPVPSVLKIKSGGATQLAIKDNIKMPEDVRLVPHEVTLIRLFPPDDKTADGRRAGSAIVRDLIADPQLTAVAELTRQQAPEGPWKELLWTGKLVTGELNGVMARRPQPKNLRAHELFIKWQDEARANGDFPGGLVDRLGSRVRDFVRMNPHYAERMQTVIERFDASCDWKPAEVVSLLDDVAAVSDLPFRLGGRGIFRSWEGDDYSYRIGAPLPRQLADSAWGRPQPNGLRMAWRLEPLAKEVRLGTLLKSRVLIHNSGKETIVFCAAEWFFPAGMEITDANGEPIEWEGGGRLGSTTFAPFRLAPGDFVEAPGESMMIGSEEEYDDGGLGFGRPDVWIDAKPGDELTLAPGSVRVDDYRQHEPVDGVPGWWPEWIAERLSRALPLPALAEQRRRMLERVTWFLFGTPPTAEEIAAFAGDASPDALESLQRRLIHRPGLTVFSGTLQSGATKFRVLPADPEEAKRPRTANGPGRFRLGKQTWFEVRRSGEGKRIINEADLQFAWTDEEGDEQIQKYAIMLPDGEASWTSAWIRASKVLWIVEQDSARQYDFSDPAEIQETTIDRAQIRDEIPLPVLKALQAAGPFNLVEQPK